MDRLGVPVNRPGEGFIDRRRFGGQRSQNGRAFAGATTRTATALTPSTSKVGRKDPKAWFCKFEFRGFLRSGSKTSTGACRCASVVKT